jgi:outer membrane lipoprotein-sorting protein
MAGIAGFGKTLSGPCSARIGLYLKSEMKIGIKIMNTQKLTSAYRAKSPYLPSIALFTLAMMTILVFASQAFAWTAQEQEMLTRVSNKLSSISTMNGEFVQTGPSGGTVEGKFYLARPGKIKFQYHPPTPISVTSDGKQVLVYDKKLQTYDLWPLSQTPLKFLLTEKLDLARSERVKHIIVEPDLIQVSLLDDSRFGGGILALIFDFKTLDLKQWTVTDQQGLNTTVAIFNVETGNKLDKKLFKIPYAIVTQAQKERRQRN